MWTIGLQHVACVSFSRLSSGMIGQLMSCGRTQLKSLAWVAKQAGAHGPAAGWSPAVISSVGIVLGRFCPPTAWSPAVISSVSIVLGRFCPPTAWSPAVVSSVDIVLGRFSQVNSSVLLRNKQCNIVAILNKLA